MDIGENTRDVLITAIQVGGGLVVGLAVAAIGFWSNRRLERERWAREDRLRADETERERRDRWRDRRRDLYARLVGLAARFVDMHTTPDGLSLENVNATIVPAYEVAGEIRLVAKGMADPAIELVKAAAEVLLARSTGGDFEALRAVYTQRLREFLLAADLDLN